MRLRRHAVYKSRASGKTFYKFEMDPPAPLIRALGWQPGDVLEAEIRGHELVVRRKKEPK